MRVEAIYCYPVKSMQGIILEQAQLCGHGLAWDRRWMLVDAQQRFITQRQLPGLATIAVELTDQALVLSHPGVDPISISLEEPRGNLRVVKVWDDHCKALPESEDVSRWLEAVLGEQAQGISLVRFATEFTRAVDEDFMAGGEAHTWFSDGYPFLITTTGSLEALNQALIAGGNAPVPMNRFRPNIVVECDAAWAEDQWATLSSENNAFQLTLRKPCQRCKVTTVDQQTGSIPEQAEPLKTLLALNTQPHLKGAHFGQNATLTAGQGGAIRVGDEVVSTHREA